MSKSKSSTQPWKSRHQHKHLPEPETSRHNWAECKSWVVLSSLLDGRHALRQELVDLFDTLIWDHVGEGPRPTYPGTAAFTLEFGLRQATPLGAVIDCPAQPRSSRNPVHSLKTYSFTTSHQAVWSDLDPNSDLQFCKLSILIIHIIGQVNRGSHFVTLVYVKIRFLLWT